jgi:C1A family cysteine protease
MNNKMGAMPPKIDIRDYQYRPAGVTVEDFPKEFALWTPEAKSQGSINSCVAHVAAEIEEYFNHKERGKYDKLSVGYIYGCRYSYKGEGMYLRDALKTLKDKGICIYNEFPHNKEVPEIINLYNQKTSWVTDTQNKISTYFSIDTKDANKIKHSLMNCGPLMISVPWYNDYTVENNKVVSPSNFKTSYGHHALLLYGWNEKGWLIQNSWGTDWGDKGKAIYPYSYPMAEAWGITDNINNIKNLYLKKQTPVTNICSKMTNGLLNIFKKCKHRK